MLPQDEEEDDEEDEDEDEDEDEEEEAWVLGCHGLHNRSLHVLDMSDQRDPRKKKRRRRKRTTRKKKWQAANRPGMLS